MRKKLLILFCAALAFRALYAYLVWTPVMKSPDESMSVMYMRTAHFIAVGLGHSQAIPGSPAFRDIERLRERASGGEVLTVSDGQRIDRRGLYTETLHPPGWALAAAATHRVFKTPIWINMQVMAVLLDSIACLLLYFLVMAVLANPAVALIAAFVYALFPPLAYEAAGLEPMGLMSFFAVSATLAVARGYKSSKALGMWAYYALAAALIGLGSYFRPDILLLGPFFGVALMWVERRFWRPFAVAVLMLAIALVVLFPWASYTHARIGKHVFTSTALGVNLVNGLGEYPNPWQLGGSDVDRVRDAYEAGIRHAFVPEADPFFRRMFWEKVSENPATLISIMAKRIVFEVMATPYDWGFEINTSVGLSSIRAQGRLLESAGYIVQKYWFRLLSAGFMFICLIGSLLLIWRKQREAPLIAVLMVVPLYFAASHVPIHMEPRYLLPGAFALFVGFAYLTVEIAHRYPIRKRAREHELPLAGA